MTDKGLEESPVLLYVNYWEIPPVRMKDRISQISQKNIKHLVVFVPWQAIESDINHSLLRFIQAVVQAKLTLSLIISPEMGLHYPYTGLPKDIIQKKDILAMAEDGTTFMSSLPPVAFEIPSFFSSDFEKRYSSFLSRLDSYFGEMKKLHPQLLDYITICQTGSFWKYFRASDFDAHQLFSGVALDYSTHAMGIFRKKIDSFFQGAEFGGPQKWKTQAKEKMNQKIFFEASEKNFRTRSLEAMKKKSPAALQSWELFTPEADPLLFFSHFLCGARNPLPDYSLLVLLLDQYAMRFDAHFMNVFHWTSMGGFAYLLDQQKYFLLLKSLLLVLSFHGNLLFEESFWFGLPVSFRSKVHAIAGYVREHDLTLVVYILYLSASFWESTVLWEQVWDQVGRSAKIIREIHTAKLYQADFEMLIVDPDILLTQDVMVVLIALARAGKVVVVPHHPYITDIAFAEIQSFLQDGNRIEVEIGFEYKILFVGSGKFVFYETEKRKEKKACADFVQALLALSEFSPLMECSKEVSHVCLEHRQTSQLLIFVLNPMAYAQKVQLQFPKAVQIKTVFSHSTESEELLVSAQQIHLQLPAFGIVPLNLDGINSSLVKEMAIAHRLSSEMPHALNMAAESQLPGYHANVDLFETFLWN